jgi:hypothetical protein
LTSSAQRPRVGLLIALQVEFGELELVDVDGLLVDRADHVTTTPGQQHRRQRHVHRLDEEMHTAIIAAGRRCSRSTFPLSRPR